MTKYSGTEPGLLAYYSCAEGNKQFVYDTTSDNTAIVECRHEWFRSRKILEYPVLYKAWN
jgi:hypothetical protein